jgi:hypothetical protein
LASEPCGVVVEEVVVGVGGVVVPEDEVSFMLLDGPCLQNESHAMMEIKNK